MPQHRVRVALGLLALAVIVVGGSLAWSGSLDSSPYVHLRRLQVGVDGNPLPTGTDVSAWSAYDGNSGDANAWLQTAATETARLALVNQPGNVTITATTGIPTNALRVWLMNETAGQGGILCIGQFTAAGALVDVLSLIHI